ncbi:3D domain-containing protein [Dysosmobacter sp.]|uniref:3D domain-containing protein n=1 Tax=Dysosmobacter sp. TaxID=2591382 RepID=UPI002A878AD2|nr:3D domain-containing protein [Dysosmobacter sp.]MDY3984838.1 3D domain-containing protein [Dysosmobacter sp.]
MSQRSEKLRRRVDTLEARMDAVELGKVWDAAEASVHNQAALDAATERNAERRRAREAERTAAKWRRVAYIALVAAIIVLVAAILVVYADAEDAEPINQRVVVTAQETAPEVTEGPEEDENELIVCALLDRANVIESCEVTWYTEDTCGKTPDDPAYGITRSGLPVVEHQTCAVDPNVIPLYSEVFVEYADGTIEQLWATDTGVRGNALDIYTPDYDYAIQCGRQHLTVWWMGPEN